MAPRSTAPTAVAEPPVVEGTLVPTTDQSTALATPTPRAVGRGKENITEADIYPSRLSLAQGTSPQIKKREDAYIEGLEEGQFFNTITGENYGPGPVTVAIVGTAKRAAIFDDAGKMVERLNWDDPRCESPGEDAQGKWIKPEGTRIHDLLLVRVVDGQPVYEDVMMMSCKKTSFKPGKRLLSLIHKTPGDTWDVLYTITSVAAKSSDGKFNFYAPKFGYLSMNAEKRKSSDAVKAFCETLYVALSKGKVKEVEDDAADAGGEDDGVPF
jgi:hypothetical protein